MPGQSLDIGRDGLPAKLTIVWIGIISPSTFGKSKWIALRRLSELLGSIFHADKFPAATFTATKIVKTGEVPARPAAQDIDLLGTGRCVFHPPPKVAKHSFATCRKLHRLAAGHFAVEDHLGYIATQIGRFYDDTVKRLR